MATPSTLTTAALTLLGAIVIGAPAQAAPSVSVADLVGFCQSGFAPADGAAPSLAPRTACITYLDGVIATVAQIAAVAGGSPGAPAARAVFCVPAPESYETLSARFLNYARANPQYGSRAAASLVVAAFAQSYPCR